MLLLAQLADFHRLGVSVWALLQILRRNQTVGKMTARPITITAALMPALMAGRMTQLWGVNRCNVDMMENSNE
jgi:hypothetical protein